MNSTDQTVLIFKHQGHYKVKPHYLILMWDQPEKQNKVSKNLPCLYNHVMKQPINPEKMQLSIFVFYNF